MSLRKAWRELDRDTVRSAPDRIAVYELGDADGESLGLAVGVLADDLREELAYGDAAKVRWTLANNREHAERLLDERSE